MKAPEALGSIRASVVEALSVAEISLTLFEIDDGVEEESRTSSNDF